MKLREGLFHFIVVAPLMLFMIYPLGSILSEAVWYDGRFTLESMSLVVLDADLRASFFDTFNIACASSVFAGLLGVPVAFSLWRYRVPGARILPLAFLLPLILPPFVGAVGMKQNFARFGSVNLLLMSSGIIDQPVDWLGSGVIGVICMQSLHLFPLVYLQTAAALSSIPASLEEAARNVGAQEKWVFRRILIPLVLPSILSSLTLVFVWSFTDLGTPLVFGVRSLLPVRVYQILTETHDNPMGFSVVCVMTIVSLTFFWLGNRIAGYRVIELQGKQVSVSPKQRMNGLGPKILSVFLFGLLGFSLLPHLGVLLLSVGERWFMSPLPTAYTLKYYGAIAIHPLTGGSVVNSLWFSLGSSFLDLVIGLIAALLLVRGRLPRIHLEVLTMIPLCVPGIVFAFGYLTAFSGTFLDARVNPVPLLIIAYSVRRLPFMVRAATAGLQQASIVLEDAARNVGASPRIVARRITLPLLRPHLFAGFVLCFAFAMLEVSDSLILATEERYFPITKAMFSLLERPDGLFVASALGVMSTLLLLTCFWIAAKVRKGSFADAFRL